jgi:hypothetical protein
LQRLVLRTLLRKLSLGLSALVLDLLRLFGALVLKILLASVLQHREDESDDDECERDYEQVHPLPYFLPAELPKGPRFSLPLMSVLLLQGVLLVPHVPATIIAHHR